MSLPLLFSAALCWSQGSGGWVLPCWWETNLRTRCYSPVIVGFPDCDSITPWNRRKQGFFAQKISTHFTPSLWKQKGDKQLRRAAASEATPTQFSSQGDSGSLFLPLIYTHRTLSPVLRLQYGSLIIQVKSGPRIKSQSQIPGHGLRFSDYYH